MATVSPAFAADVTLTATNAINTSSFNAALSWSNNQAPAAGNAYIVPTGLSLRTPADATTNFTFGGDSLTLNGSSLVYKGGTNINTITVNNFTWNGATINNASNSSTAFIIAGNQITVAGTGTSTVFANNATITLNAPVVGSSGTLVLSSNGSTSGRQVVLSGANTYTGNIQVNGLSGAVLTATTGKLAFALGTSGAYNTVSGTGTATPFAFNGIFTINLTGASTTVGTTYPLLVVNSMAATFGTTFAVQDWFQAGNVWVSPDGNYSFSTATGLLTVIPTDSDHDGLPDSWETAYFGNLDQTGTGDPDNDWCTNAEEFAASTNPNARNSFPDTDTDGLPDGWERHYFGSLASLPTDDPDGDYNTNLEEFTAQTDPASRLSFPDADTDQMADGWETHFFGSPASCEPGVDADGDLYSNLAEFTANTNPTNLYSSPDQDGDGLPDGWEIHYFGLANESLAQAIAHVDGTADSDGDGRSDLIEYHAGTNPKAADTAPPTLAYWRFEELTAGLVPYPQVAGAVKDVSGSGNDMITYADYTAPTYTTRAADWTVPNTRAMNRASLNFTAVAGNRYTCDNIYTPGTAPINTMVFSAYTVEASFRTTLTGTAQGIIGKGGNPTGATAPYQAPFTLKLNAANKVVAGMVDAAPAAHEVVSTRTISAGSWYSAAVTISADTLSLWLKAPGDNAYVLEGSTTISGAFPTTVANASWVIGQTEYNAAGNFTGFDSFTGDLDEIRISSRVLDASEFIATTRFTEGDSDGDGLPDAWETAYFGNLDQIPGGDYDRDGTDNLTEYRLGMIPNDGTSRFMALLSGGGIYWTSAAGFTFTVQRSTTLAAGSWQTIAVVAGEAGATFYMDPEPPAGKAFYRVILNP
ncbi:hypothetical protein KBB96_18745 [Luteolibacter ambystomatis]|uniref:LamG-like jellyroll fold domain-containing protein n=1 Tax=Luteolibacter ambystomatis TaxID=2824561 RepID=A0A975G8U0_9BACT|nr:LamG-like jellyroll fold domain-containing protein [Luteolibacter ambystomatis]QUE50886.1 hypothetical protein KBB96_18745 [Luteolibacter ambystomatis]